MRPSLALLAVFSCINLVRAQSPTHVNGGSPLPVEAMRRVHGRAQIFDTPPKFISGHAPTRSKAAPGEAAAAVIAFVIDEAGRPRNIQVVKALQHICLRMPLPRSKNGVFYRP